MFLFLAWLLPVRWEANGEHRPLGCAECQWSQLFPMCAGFIPGPPNRWFLVVFGYLKASRNHLLRGTGIVFFFFNSCYYAWCQGLSLIHLVLKPLVTVSKGFHNRNAKKSLWIKTIIYKFIWIPSQESKRRRRGARVRSPFGTNSLATAHTLWTEYRRGAVVFFFFSGVSHPWMVFRSWWCFMCFAGVLCFRFFRWPGLCGWWFPVKNRNQASGLLGLSCLIFFFSRNNRDVLHLKNLGVSCQKETYEPQMLDFIPELVVEGMDTRSVWLWALNGCLAVRLEEAADDPFRFFFFFFFFPKPFQCPMELLRK